MPPKQTQNIQKAEKLPAKKGGLQKGAKLSKVTLARVIQIKHSRDRLNATFLSPGQDRVIEDIKTTDPDFPLKRDAVRRVLKQLKAGVSPESVAAEHGKGKGAPITKTTAAAAAAVKCDLATNPNSTVHSQRILAKKYGMSAASMNRVVKRKLEMKVFRKVKTCFAKAATRAKRVSIAKEILAGMGKKWSRDEIWYSDESWSDTTGNKFNPQNERVYAEKHVLKSDLTDKGKLMAPQQQRGRGVMAHMTVSSFAGGVVLQPHIVPDKVRVNSTYYRENVLSADVFPKIRAATMNAEGVSQRWVFMQDLASPHTAKETVALLKKEKTRVLPRMPKGADCNPLDINVWGSISTAIKAVPLCQRDTLPKLKAVVVKCIDALRADEHWAKTVKRCCRSVPKRLAWVAENEGQQIIGKSWKKNNAQA